ncbi:RHS repeat-associated core domain-containing protein [Myxococcota bacterium]|nr:RHS repeat-associated core domain-containing protein [Myxococcota bacterium]MBU1496877.1 RHS repeat-associated core domain-containing protein [Myxococcota bacterium]
MAAHSGNKLSSSHEEIDHRLFSSIFRLDQSAFLEYFSNNAMRRASTLSVLESNHCSAAGGFYPENKIKGEIIDNRTNPLWIDSEPDRIFNIAMTYDCFNQLLSTSYTYSEPGKLYDGRMFHYMEYDYDILGNLVKKITTRHLDKDSVPVDNPPDEFYKTWFGTATYGSGTAGPDAMSSAGDGAGNTIAIGYDGAGNMTTLTINKSGEITDYNYEWDEFNRLKQASRTGGPSGTPDYDATYFYLLSTLFLRKRCLPPGRFSSKIDLYGSVRVGKVEEKDSVTEHTLYINEAVIRKFLALSVFSAKKSLPPSERFSSKIVREERWNGTSYNLVRYIFVRKFLALSVFSAKKSLPPGERFSSKIVLDGSRLARLDISGTTTTRRWMHPDHLGTTGCITKDGDSEGQAETITLYLPYGTVPSASLRESTLEEKSETGFRDPYGFTGKELEVDLGIMYFGARWYNPQLGRWLSPDPLYLVSTAKNAERQQNLYEYASNNPWKFVDPDGFKKTLAVVNGTTFTHNGKKYMNAVKMDGVAMRTSIKVNDIKIFQLKLIFRNEKLEKVVKNFGWSQPYRLKNGSKIYFSILYKLDCQSFMLYLRSQYKKYAKIKYYTGKGYMSINTIIGALFIGLFQQNPNHMFLDKITNKIKLYNKENENSEKYRTCSRVTRRNPPGEIPHPG